MSELAKKIEKLYKKGLYPKDWITADMQKGAITLDEFYEITEGKNGNDD